MQITIHNEFHGTEYALRVKGPLSAAQIRRCRRALCGIPACHCGGPLGERGPQPVLIELLPDGRIALTARLDAL